MIINYIRFCKILGLLSLATTIGAQTLPKVTLSQQVQSNNLSETADTVFVSKFLNVDTATLYVDAVNNRVGIGTSSPGYPLSIEITDTSGYSLQSIGKYRQDINNATIEFWNTGGTTRSGYFQGHATLGFYFWYQVNAPMYFATNNTQRMTIDGSGNIGAPSGTNIYNASDYRLKRNITNIDNGLSSLLKLNPVSFMWKEGFVESEENKTMLGFIAQEVVDAVPEAVEYFGTDINLNGEVISSPLRVNEKFLIPITVKAIQEQQAIIQSQQAEIETLKNQYNDLLQRIINLENK